MLLDLGLPDSQGADTVTRLRQSQPGVPVVVLTGLDDEAVGISAMQLGAQDYLVKGSLVPSVLGRSIRYAIERKRAEQAVMAQLKEAAIVEERNRIAGEIHDILAQDFVGILLQLKLPASLMVRTPLRQASAFNSPRPWRAAALRKRGARFGHCVRRNWMPRDWLARCRVSLAG